MFFLSYYSFYEIFSSFDSMCYITSIPTIYFFNYFPSKSLSLHAVLYITIFFRYCPLTSIECLSFCFLCDHSSLFLRRYYLFLSFLPLFISFASPFSFPCLSSTVPYLRFLISVETNKCQWTLSSFLLLHRQLFPKWKTLYTISHFIMSCFV